jgi:hypothetical protein
VAALVGVAPEAAAAEGHEAAGGHLGQRRSQQQ